MWSSEMVVKHRNDQKKPTNIIYDALACGEPGVKIIDFSQSRCYYSRAIKLRANSSQRKVCDRYFVGIVVAVM